jgi:hypothetical protein
VYQKQSLIKSKEGVARMITIYKKLLLFSCVFMFSPVVAKKHTKKLQLLVVPGDASYIFALNDGTGITNDPGAPRPQGSYYETNAFIFPGGTIDKNQTDFSVDKHGNPINLAENIGMAYFIETMLQTVDFGSGMFPPVGVPLNLLDYVIPATENLIEQSEMRLFFRYPCHGTNVIYGMGFAAINMFPPVTGEPFINFSFGVVGASGCNSLVESHVKRAYCCGDYTPVSSCSASDCDPKPIKIRGNSLTGKVYLAQTGPVVAIINIKFEEEIVYKD